MAENDPQKTQPPQQQTPPAPAAAAPTTPAAVQPQAPPQAVKSPVLTHGVEPREPVTRVQLPDYFEDDTIVARPLVVPDFVNLRAKNPGISLRWINYAVPTENGNSTLRYEQAKAMGFVNATAADIYTPPEAYVRDGGTKIVNGDLILMKIDAARYKGALKYKDQQALRLGSKFATENVGAAELKRAAREVGAAPRNTQKISAYVPTVAEIERMLGKEAVAETYGPHATSE